MKEKPTESREGVKGGGLRPFSSPPCRVKGQRPLWVGFGATPQLFLVKPTQRKKTSKVAAAKRPAPKLRAASDAPPSCSIHHLCCVAPDGRDHDAGLATIAAFPASRGFRARDRSPRALWGAKSALLMQPLAVLRRKERQLDVFEAFLHPMRLAKQGNMM